jgi:hypothetical protein
VGHYCLKAVIGKGLAKAGNFVASRQKLGCLHGLTARGMAERAALTQRSLQRKLANTLCSALRLGRCGARLVGMARELGRAMR